MRWAILTGVLLLGTILAGCLGSDETPPVPDPVPAPGMDVPEGVQFFAGNQSLVPDASDFVLGVPERVLTGFQGAEPTVGITSTGAIFLAAFEDLLRSTDGGLGWESVYNFRLEGAPVDPLSNSDPMMWVDPWTDIVYDAPMFPPLLCSSIIASEDDGETWNERHAACPVLQPFDRQTLSSGPPGPDAPPAAGALHDTVLYLCYNQLATSSCLTSYDGGLSWPVNVPVWDVATAPAGSENCAGQTGHPMAAQDGTMVVPKAWFCDGFFASVSTDSGLTWDVKTGPQLGGDTLSPEIAFTPDGTMYAVWQGGDHLPYMTRITMNELKACDVVCPDAWAGPWVVSPPDVTSTVFVAASAGSDGRVAMAFLGTNETDKYPSNAPDGTHWHLYIVVTESGAAEEPVFVSYRVTPEDDPVQVGPIWIGGGGDPSRNLLDFIDSAVSPDGTFYVSYTEGCTEGCTGNADATGSDSRDRQAAVAWLADWSLYSP